MTKKLFILLSTTGRPLTAKLYILDISEHYLLPLILEDTFPTPSELVVTVFHKSHARYPVSSVSLWQFQAILHQSTFLNASSFEPSSGCSA
jgi:hypothetical protein